MPAKTNRLKEEKTKKKPRHSQVKKAKKGNGFRSFVNLFRNRQFQQIIGLFLILLSVFLSLSFISYFSSWKADDSVMSKSLYDLLSDRQLIVHNSMGKVGAFVSDLIIKQGFGIASFFIIIYVFVAGMKLLWKGSPLSAWLTFRLCLVGLVWVSVTFAYFKTMFTEDWLPGWFGLYVVGWLKNVLGYPGTGLLLLFLLLSFLVIIGFFTYFHFRMPHVNVFNRRGKTEDQQGAGEKPDKDDDFDQPSAGLKQDAEKTNGTSGNRKNTLREKEEDRYNTQEHYVKPDEDELEDDNDLLRKKDKKSDAKEIELIPVNRIQPELVRKNAMQEVDFSVENADVSGLDKADDKPPQPDKKNMSVIPDTANYDPRLDLPHYKFPPLDLLNDYGSDRINVQKEELEANKNRIVETLNQYQIQIQKIKATIGPTVTLYEIIPAPGIRISKIKNLEDDIALSLSAFGIRIIAPIPGKGTIGIEVPNQNPDIVSMKSILASEKFQSSKYELPFGMGKTISNEAYVADLTRMPHILMAGATGQGKSVGLNAIIASFLYTKHPSELKFVMVDPKKVELTLFSKIERHYLAKLPDSEEAIITDTRKVVRTLNSLGIEMDTRYELLKDAQVRNIKEYNTKFLARMLNPNHGHHFMPYIVLVIDEFADLIMTAGKEIEIPLTRLAQLARAVGIHLIIATQRPSVNIITGSIKANFPARVAFRVISKVDSRTILDSQGADQLIGRGDMLLSTGSDLIRLQCAFIDTPEIDKLTDFIGSQRAYPDAYHLPEYSDEQDEPVTEFDPDERDPLFEEAAKIIVQNQQGSTSLLQRKMKIGYNRAGRIIDQLEAAGIVGPFEGSKARDVLIHSEAELEQFLRSLDI